MPHSHGLHRRLHQDSRQKLDLGDDPELLNYVKSIKNEGDFIALLEAVIQTAASQ